MAALGWRERVCDHLWTHLKSPHPLLPHLIVIYRAASVLLGLSRVKVINKTAPRYLSGHKQKVEKLVYDAVRNADRRFVSYQRVVVAAAPPLSCGRLCAAAFSFQRSSMSDLIDPTTMDVQYVTSSVASAACESAAVLLPCRSRPGTRRSRTPWWIPVCNGGPPCPAFGPARPSAGDDRDGYRLSNVGDGVATGDASTRGQLLSTCRMCIKVVPPTRLPSSTIVQSVPLRLRSVCAAGVVGLGPVDASGERVVRWVRLRIPVT